MKTYHSPAINPPMAPVTPRPKTQMLTVAGDMGHCPHYAVIMQQEAWTIFPLVSNLTVVQL